MDNPHIPLPYGPEERAYSTIGPNVFRLWCSRTLGDAVDTVSERGSGILNGFEFPHSMRRCHEGHLVALLSGVELWLSIGNRAQAVGWLKVLLAEAPNRPRMAYDLDAVFEQAEALFAGLVHLDDDLAALDPVAVMDHRFGADRLTKGSAPADPTPLKAPPGSKAESPREPASRLWGPTIAVVALVALTFLILRGC